MRVFLRILLSFWLVMLVLLAIITASPFLSSSLQDERLRGFPLATVQRCARVAALQYRKGGAEALRKQALECNDGRLIDPAADRLTDLSGRIIPPYGIQTMRRAREGSEVLVQPLPEGTLVALHTDPGLPESLIYMTVAPLSSRHVWNVPPYVPLCIITGILAFLAAAYFVHPITRLSKVAESFGAGNLKARVDPAVAKRKDEIGDLGRTLNQMAARIESLIESYRTFLAQASHELGSPLTRLNIALALARRKADGQLAPELDRIDYESAQLVSLVEEMLLLARLESGNELSRHVKTFRLDEVVAVACDNATFEAAQMNKSVLVENIQELQMSGYPDLLARALDNVIRNALRFTPESGSIQVSCSRVANRPIGIILIQDDGPGVPPGFETSIFEPFVRLPNTSAESTPGSGLGLAIARQATVANGGMITAHSGLGQGLTVRFELPLFPAQA